jgi:hypothetical protein
MRRPPRRLLWEMWKKKPAFGSLLLTLLAACLTRRRKERCRVDVECYPGIPYYRHMLWKAALYADVRLLPYRSAKPSAADAARPRLRLFWSVTTTIAGPKDPPPPEWRRGALNGGLCDTSKRNVERVFAQVFGYALAVDPTTHQGLCVAKSDRHNSSHDGRVIECPISEADPGLAYERLIDNRTDGGAVEDLRVPVVGGEIPFVYRKHRPFCDRFSNTNLWVGLATAEQVLSEGERELLRVFCRAMGLDLGELDVLRDASDTRIYVVDVNPTAWGPPRPLQTAEAIRAVRTYAAALARLTEQTTDKLSILGLAIRQPTASGDVG